VPEIIIIALPLGTLLALLYSLAAMSRSNEIISMLGAGLSITRILVPLMAVGVVLAGVTAYFNYEGAPHATGVKKDLVGEIKHGRKKERTIRGHLFRNREDSRTWFVSRLPLKQDSLRDVQIVQQDENGNISDQWYAREAFYNHDSSSWTLRGARHVRMSPEGDVVESGGTRTIEIDGWSETPWRVGSSMMIADFMSVPELRDYLFHNGDFPDQRLAPYRLWCYAAGRSNTACLAHQALALRNGPRNLDAWRL
jgi:lipopolysaccharide export LptBFGC system permease protein LptF